MIIKGSFDISFGNDRMCVWTFEFRDFGKAFNNDYLYTHQRALTFLWCCTLLSTFSYEVFAVARTISLPAGFSPCELAVPLHTEIYERVHGVDDLKPNRTIFVYFSASWTHWVSVVAGTCFWLCRTFTGCGLSGHHMTSLKIPPPLHFQ